MIKTRANSDYIFKSDHETMREIQDFEGGNISMTNGKTSPIGSIPVKKKTLDPMPLTRPTEFTEKNGMGQVPDDLDPDPSFSDSSSKKKKCDKKKKRRKYKKNDSSDPSLSDDSDSSDDSDYRRKNI